MGAAGPVQIGEQGQSPGLLSGPFSHRLIHLVLIGQTVYQLGLECILGQKGSATHQSTDLVLVKIAGLGNSVHQLAEL